MHPACLCLLLLTAVPGRTDTPVMVLSEGRVISAADFSIGPSGELIVVPAGKGEPPESIVVDSPALLDASMVPKAKPGQPKAAGTGASVQLTCGEILQGSIVEPDSPGTIRFNTCHFGPQRLALEKIATIHLAGRRASRPATDSGRDHPCLVLTNGDLIAGAIKLITPTAVTIDSAFGETETDISRVAGITLAGDPPLVDGRTTGQLICSLADGQRWYVDNLAAGPAKGQVRLHRAGSAADLPVTHLRQLVFAGWTIRELIALGPPEVRTTPYLGGTVPVQIDEARSRRPRAIGNRSFLGGITARPRSRVSYTLNTPAAYLIGWVGIDPVRGSAGICDARIESDGKTLVSFNGLTARAGAQRIAVSTTNLNHITLITDFGPNAEIGDCLNWCELMLIEKKPPATSQGHVLLNHPGANNGQAIVRERLAYEARDAVLFRLPLPLEYTASSIRSREYGPQAGHRTSSIDAGPRE